MIAGAIGIIGSFVFCIVIMRMQLVEIRELKKGHCQEIHLINAFIPPKESRDPEMERLQKIVDGLEHQ
jgi:hypothetical protein